MLIARMDRSRITATAIPPDGTPLPESSLEVFDVDVAEDDELPSAGVGTWVVVSEAGIELEEDDVMAELVVGAMVADESVVVVESSSLDVLGDSSESSEVLWLVVEEAVDLDCLDDAVVVAVTGGGKVTAEPLVVAAATVVVPALSIPRRLFTEPAISFRRLPCLRLCACVGTSFWTAVLNMTKGWATTRHKEM